MLKNSNKVIGNEGEDRVVAWLMQEGYTLIARNYRWRAGEIDIIARKNEIIAFIEVKARLSLYFPLSQVITFAKQKKITITARRFISEYGSLFSDVVYRFDVVLVCIPSKTIVSYIDNAFYAE